MIYNDSWTEGLKPRQQNLIVEYVLNQCKLFKGIAGWKNLNSAKAFLNSEKGRRAQRKYVELFYDKTKDTIKAMIVKLAMTRAFYDPADIITATGKFVIENLEDLHKLGDLSKCIDGIETTVAAGGIRVTKIKLCDRQYWVEFLVKVFRVLEKDDTDEFLGEKSIFDMSDEERNEDTKELLQKGGIKFLKSIGFNLKLLTSDENVNENGKEKK